MSEFVHKHKQRKKRVSKQRDEEKVGRERKNIFIELEKWAQSAHMTRKSNKNQAKIT